MDLSPARNTRTTDAPQLGPPVDQRPEPPGGELWAHARPTAPPSLLAAGFLLPIVRAPRFGARV
jgi:hypothetical protein